MAQGPVAVRLSRLPEFVRLRDAVKASPSVAAKLAAVDAGAGYYFKGFALPVAARIRAALALNVLEDALSDAPARWADGGHDARPPGVVAAQVLHAALLGCADVTLIPALSELGPATIAAALAGGPAVAVALRLGAKYGLGGATIADAVKTDMGLRVALDLLRRADPDAAAIVREGAEKAAAAHSEAYGAIVRENFKKRFAEAANPFTNPVFGDLFKAGAAIVAAAVILPKVLDSKG